MKKPKSIYILWEDSLDRIYDKPEQAKIAELTEPQAVRLDQDSWQESKELLSDVQIVMSGWGMAFMNEDFLEAAPKLKHVFYGSGSVRGFYKQAAIDRGVGISSAWLANAIPVAEFAYATILLSLKKAWRCNRMLKESREWERSIIVPGAFRSTVGLVSLGAIGRRVAERLKGNDVNVIAYDPYLNQSEANSLGVESVSLEELFARADVISLHAPMLPATIGMVTRELLHSMKPNASLINTARGPLIDEPALVELLRKREDIDAFLDVVADEPHVSPDNPLFGLPNVFLTPHIAGSMDTECQRMGQYMVSELERYLKNEPLEYAVTEKLLETMA